MDFELSEDQIALRDSVRSFVAKEVLPLAPQIDREDRFPMELWPKLGELGLLGLGIPEEAGGSGGDMITCLVAWEELAYASTGVALSTGAHGNLCTFNVFRNGSDEQRARWVPDLCAGKKVGALAITEPEAGSDAVGMTTTAVRDGDDYVLNGTKTLITNATIADVFLLYAKTDPSAGPKGISAFVIEAGTEGLTLSSEIPKMGCKGSPTGQVFLQDCRVPAANRLGPEGHGIHVMMSGLDVERVAMAILAVAGARRALDLSLAYAQERRQFGRPIADFQLIQAKLADMYTKIEAARLLVLRAAACIDGMQRGGKGTEIHKLSAAALLFAGEAGNEIAYEAVQVHGGYGFTDEYEVSRLYRDMRLATLGAGTAEVRRLIIARELLGK